MTRKNLATNTVVTFPLMKPGRFIDDKNARVAASAGSFKVQEASLNDGGEYLYRAQVLIINPERLFTEALTKIPASTKQVIVNTNPNFVQVSAARLAENFAIKPGNMPSPTTVEKGNSFSNDAENSFTGIEYVKKVNIPQLKAFPTNVVAKRNVEGLAKNVITWNIQGSKASIFKFLIYVTVGRDQTVQCAEVSPNLSEDGNFFYEDRVYTKEIVPVSYAVQVVYQNPLGSTSKAIKSNEIYTGTKIPVQILDLAVKKWIKRLPTTRIADLTKDAFESRLDKSYMEDPLYSSPLISNSSGDLQNQINIDKSIKSELSSESVEITNQLNPKRDFRK